MHFHVVLVKVVAMTFAAAGIFSACFAEQDERSRMREQQAGMFLLRF
jgi:hypothetical protein